jgi:hypothetical protein
MQIMNKQMWSFFVINLIFFGLVWIFVINENVISKPWYSGILWIVLFLMNWLVGKLLIRKIIRAIYWEIIVFIMLLPLVLFLLDTSIRYFIFSFDYLSGFLSSLLGFIWVINFSAQYVIHRNSLNDEFGDSGGGGKRSSRWLFLRYLRPLIPGIAFIVSRNLSSQDKLLAEGFIFYV